MKKASSASDSIRRNTCSVTTLTVTVPHIGIDVTDGDIVEDLGNGFGIDLETGELELEIAPGLDIPIW